LVIHYFLFVSVISVIGHLAGDVASKELNEIGLLCKNKDRRHRAGRPLPCQKF
jgi:hypothetical protein